MRRGARRPASRPPGLHPLPAGEDRSFFARFWFFARTAPFRWTPLARRLHAACKPLVSRSTCPFVRVFVGLCCVGGAVALRSRSARATRSRRWRSTRARCALGPPGRAAPGAPRGRSVSAPAVAVAARGRSPGAAPLRRPLRAPLRSAPAGPLPRQGRGPLPPPLRSACAPLPAPLRSVSARAVALDAAARRPTHCPTRAGRARPRGFAPRAGSVARLPGSRSRSAPRPPRRASGGRAASLSATARTWRARPRPLRARPPGSPSGSAPGAPSPSPFGRRAAPSAPPPGSARRPPAPPGALPSPWVAPPPGRRGGGGARTSARRAASLGGLGRRASSASGRWRSLPPQWPLQQ